MSNGTGLEQLRQEFIGLFDRIVEAARADERAATQSILQDTLARLAGAVGVPPPVPAPPPIPRPVKVQHFAELDASQRGKRARSGFVREAAERILSASPIPLSPQKIVGLGAQQGITLKESSVRMAL